MLLVEGGFLMPDLMVVDPLPRNRHNGGALPSEEGRRPARRRRGRFGNAASTSNLALWSGSPG
jgi:hypothetical protein